MDGLLCWQGLNTKSQRRLRLMLGCLLAMCVRPSYVLLLLEVVLEWWSSTQDLKRAFWHEKVTAVSADVLRLTHFTHRLLAEHILWEPWSRCKDLTKRTGQSRNQSSWQRNTEISLLCLKKRWTSPHALKGIAPRDIIFFLSEICLNLRFALPSELLPRYSPLTPLKLACSFIIYVCLTQT